MSIFTSLGILILITLIMSFLMLIPGIFALFYHYASGKYQPQKIDNLCIFFVLGVESLATILFVSINFILRFLSFTETSFEKNILTWIFIGVLLALSIASFLFYFRKGPGTRLFISRKIANNLNDKAKSVKSRQDAFLLGFISGIPELIFTIPLYIIASVEFAQVSMLNAFCPAIIIIFFLGIIIPLFIVYGLYRTDRNLATIQRFRTRNKNFFRFLISLLYLVLAITIICFRIFV